EVLELDRRDALAEQAIDDARRRVPAAVEEHRADERLEDIRQDARLVAAAALLLALAEQDEAADIELARDRRQPGLADDLQPRDAEVALATARVARHQLVCDGEAEHRVADELEPLVIVERLRLLVAPARVTHRLLEPRAFDERVAEHRFE